MWCLSMHVSFVETFSFYLDRITNWIYSLQRLGITDIESTFMLIFRMYYDFFLESFSSLYNLFILVQFIFIQDKKNDFKWYLHMHDFFFRIIFHLIVQYVILEYNYCFLSIYDIFNIQKSGKDLSIVLYIYIYKFFLGLFCINLDMEIKQLM